MNAYIKSFLNFLWPKTPRPGVNPDTRSLDQQLSDPVHEELAEGLSGVAWTVKSPTAWRSVSPLRSQYLWSGDCVAFSTTTGKQFDSNISYPLSAYEFYDRRSNYPAEGMIPFEGLQLMAYGGAIPDADLPPSDNMLESELDSRVLRTQAIKDKAALLAGGIPTKIVNIDIDTIASIISQGISVKLCFHFTQNEWTAIPQLLAGGDIHHQVVGVDYSLVNGKKAIIIQDSCFLNSTSNFPHGTRAITEEFLLERCYFAGYVKPTPASIPTPPAPVHVFSVDMQSGDNNNEVLLLQTKLQNLGFFPSIKPTGYFGGITYTAVKAYQKANSIPQTGYVGVLTRANLSK